MAKDGLDVMDVELNPRPEYINRDRKERESFLSQVGNFTTEERELFNLLCDNWEHEIGYAKFVTKINKRHPIDEKFLASLMKKLRSSGCGILLTKFVRGERGVDKIILTDVHSHYFYFYFINNEFQKNLEEISNDFVEESNFEKYDINYSSLNPMDLNVEFLNKKFIKNEAHKNNIYTIKLQGCSSFFVTSETLQDLISISARKVKYYFKSDNFIEFIAKLMDSSISKVRSTVDRFEISSWRHLVIEIIKNKKAINGKFKNVSSCFFKAVSILYYYSTSELKQKDKELEDEKQLKETLKTISNQIREREFKPYSQEQFNTLFEEYNSDAPEIKSKFYEQYVDNKSRIGLTEIVFIGQFYIHQDNLYKVFLDQIALATTELWEYYVKEYKKCLFSNSSDASLLEGYPFECNIMSKLQSDYPILYDLISKKSMLAESIIHFCKKRGHSQGKLHSMLSIYFIEGTSELIDINSIFHLNAVDLFEKAYESLPSYKRFFNFIFGQYNKNVERFTGHRKKKNKNKKGSSKVSRGRSNSTKDYFSSAPDYPSSRKSIIQEDTYTRDNKYYNKNQIEDAWSNLGNELSKKKRT